MYLPKGNADGLGKIREKELEKSARFLGEAHIKTSAVLK
jgi:hypothetical protein